MAGVTEHSRLTRHVALNAVGWVIPAVCALLAVPALARQLGPERFGLLSLTWAGVSLFAILDLGLGRAVSVVVADRRARGRHVEVRGLVRAAGVLSWLIFAPLAVLGALAAPWAARTLLDLPPTLREEGVRTLRWLALVLPIVVHGIVLRAALEGAFRFGVVNAFRVPLGVMTWAGPWLAALYTDDVSRLALVVVAGRIAYWVGQWGLLALDAPSAGTADAEPPDATSPYSALWATGSWITLSGVLSPLLTNLDRLLVPLVAPIAVVGWYVAAGEAATKLWLFPAALGPVLAPALAAAFARGEPAVATQLLTRATRVSGVVLALPAALAVLGAEPVLRWWLDSAFAPEVVPVFRWFVAAIFANSVAQVAYAGLQAGGAAREAARLHLVELPLFLVALLVAAWSTGPIGIAAVWGARLLIDAVGMMALGVRHVGLPVSEALRWGAVTLLLLLPSVWRLGAG